DLRDIHSFPTRRSSDLVVIGEQTGGNQNIEELGAFVHFTGNPVLYQILAFQLFDGRVAEVEIAVVVNKGIHRGDFVSAVVVQQVTVIAFHVDHAFHVVQQGWRLKLAVGFFTQMENIQASGQVLISRGLIRNEVGGGFD